MIPKLEKGKISMIRCEFSTGKLLNNDNTKYSRDKLVNEYYLVFDSLIEAKNKSNEFKKITDFEFETYYYDYLGNLIEVVYPENSIFNKLDKKKSE